HSLQHGRVQLGRGVLAQGPAHRQIQSLADQPDGFGFDSASRVARVREASGKTTSLETDPWHSIEAPRVRSRTVRSGGAIPEHCTASGSVVE
ncbi:MAG: hypothetical protein ACXW14_07930, partial [Burkholderiaceae bacterium]